MAESFAVLLVRAFENFDPESESIFFEDAYQFDVTEDAFNFITVQQTVGVYKYVDPTERFTGTVVTKGTWEGGPYYVGIHFSESQGASFTVGTTDDPLITIRVTSDVSSSSSTSTSSTSQSSSSSSSSNLYADHLVVRHVLVNQGLHNLLPWSLTIESGLTSEVANTSLPWVIEGENQNNFDFTELSNVTTDVVAAKTSAPVYLQEDNESRYVHHYAFFVDVISKDQSGLQDVSVRTNEDIYEYETVDGGAYVIPKFTWTHEVSARASTGTASEVADAVGAVWVGTENKVSKINYSLTAAAESSTISTDSPVYNVVLRDRSNQMFITTYNNLFLYNVDSFYNADGVTETNVGKEKEVANSDNDIMRWHDPANEWIWSTRSYSGELVKLDQNTLTSLVTFGDLDAPFRSIYNKWHGGFIVAGTHVLWRVTAVSTYTLYRVVDYKIVDMCVSDNGAVCLLLRGDNDVIRILKPDIASLGLNLILEDKLARFCVDCGNNRFYILAEQSFQEGQYTSTHYLFDANSETLETFEQSSAIVPPPEDTSVPPVTDKMEMNSPDGGEFWQKGETYDIKWLSTESVSNLVKIELYKSSTLLMTITAETTNTGVYSWTIPDNLETDTDYQIYVSLLTAGFNEDNVASSASAFNIVDVIPGSDIPEEPINYDQAASVVYNDVQDHVVIVLQNGFLLIFDLQTKEFHGLIDTGVPGIRTATFQDDKIRIHTKNEKVRVFVGTEPYWSDKWDSGVVETELTSMYYGGGNNLERGKEYYANIQIYSDTGEWTEVQQAAFIVPR